MRYFTTDSRLVAADGETAHDLSTAPDGPNSFRALAREAAAADAGLDAVADRYVDAADEVALDDVVAAAEVPVAAEEVWAAGVTYQISEEARESESAMPDVYLDVYSADRPEIFFKATPSRTVGPGDRVGIRGDSDWDVPEPELGVVLHDGDIVGYTVGNDMSSRSIEGANPLYLPQAKVYDRCCSLGPAVASPETVADPHDLEMSVEIERDGDLVYEDATDTGQMARTCEELVSYLTRHNPMPELCVLLTGTSLVPPDEFTLREGDVVSIDIEDVGTLSNDVVEV